MIDAKTREAETLQAQITELERVAENKDRQLQEQHHAMQAKDRQVREQQYSIQIKDKQLQEKECTIQAKDKQLREQQHSMTEKDGILDVKNRELLAKDRQLQLEVARRKRKERELQQMLHSGVVAEFQQSLQQKNDTITHLQQILSAYKRKEQLELQQDTEGQKQQKQPVAKAQKAPAAVQKDVGKMRWEKKGNAPENMIRGVVVVLRNTAYFMPADSYKVYSYKHGALWSKLPDNYNRNCGLAVIDGILTSVGGFRNGPTNTLLSLREEREWSNIITPMPTPRQNVACVSTKQSLVVAGGFAGGSRLTAVEVMNTSTKQWSTASPLPQASRSMSATISGDTLYLAGGYTGGLMSSPPKSVFTCFLPDLLSSTIKSQLQQTPSTSRNVWVKICNLPVSLSTLVSFGSDLLAIGGEDDSGRATSAVYRYDRHTNSWTLTSKMNEKRSYCLAVTLPRGCLIAVGGTTSDSVEMLQ